MKLPQVTYLGDTLNSSGDINDTVSSRAMKAIGINSQISSILSNISLGMFHFEIALVLRESMLINAILINSESWYFVSKKNLEYFEAADIKLFQNCFKSHPNTVREAYFLETGRQQIRYILSKRVFMFLHNILRRDKSELIYKVYSAQKIKPTRGDWFSMVQVEKSKYNIHLTDEEISKLSKPAFKKIIDRAINSKSFQNLTENRKSKLQNIIKHTSQGKNHLSVMQPYLKTSELSTEQKQTLFSLRCRNMSVKSNYKMKYQNDNMNCRMCFDPLSYENKIHTFSCHVLTSGIPVNNEVKFEHIFGDLKQQVCAAKYYTKLIRKRNLILELKENS